MNKLGFSICDPGGHPWICAVPKRFITSEIKHLQNKLKREGMKVRRTTQKDIKEIVNWKFENYLKRIETAKNQKEIDALE
ncbi:MAG TPA: hypothetical protein VI911_10175 [Patescibacteria group bacterium]|nr:hypothetical protein [Patescibacteria group bacterium]